METGQKPVLDWQCIKVVGTPEHTPGKLRTLLGCDYHTRHYRLLWNGPLGYWEPYTFESVTHWAEIEHLLPEIPLLRAD